MQKIDRAGLGSVLLSLALFVVGFIFPPVNDPESKLIFGGLALVAAVLGTILMVRRWPETPSAGASERSGGMEVSQEQRSGSQIAQTGDNAMAQHGERNVVVSTGGTYNEAVKQTHKEDDGRIFVNLTPTGLSNIYENRLAIEADRIFDRYRGKWLRVSGFIDNIQSVSPQKSMLTFQNPYVAMFFDGKKQADRVSVLQKGERVTAIGKIAKAGPTSVRLDECEIESR